MSQWTLFDEFVATEEYRNSIRELESELRHAYHIGEPPSIPSGRLGATLSRWFRRILATLSRWLGKILVTSGERLLRYAD